MPGTDWTEKNNIQETVENGCHLTFEPLGAVELIAYGMKEDWYKVEYKEREEQFLGLHLNFYKKKTALKK